MSTSKMHGFASQIRVGWIKTVPQDQYSALPLIGIAKKLAYHMAAASLKNQVDPYHIPESGIPENQIYRFIDGIEPEFCQLGTCKAMFTGVFGLNNIVFSGGVVHLILDHGWVPPIHFLDLLKDLEDPPSLVEVPYWIVPHGVPITLSQSFIRVG